MIPDNSHPHANAASKAKSPRNGKKRKKEITSQKDTKLKGQELIFYLFIYFYHNRRSQKTVRSKNKFQLFLPALHVQHTTLPTTCFFRYLFLRTTALQNSKSPPQLDLR